MGEAKSFAAFDLEAAAVAPELAYVTARYAALAPFGMVADLLSELLPVSGAVNAGTVRNRTMRIGEAVVQANVLLTTAEPATARPLEPIVVGLDGGHVRSKLTEQRLNQRRRMVGHPQAPDMTVDPVGKELFRRIKLRCSTSVL